MTEDLFSWLLRAAVLIWCLYIGAMLVKTFRSGKDPGAPADDKSDRNPPT